MGTALTGIRSTSDSLFFIITMTYGRRFAFHDYNRLAAEDEREVGDSTDMDGSDDWIVTDDDEDNDDVLGRLGQDGIATAEAPF